MDNICHDIYTLSLAAFCECLFDKRYKAMTKAGEPADGEIMSAWNDLYEEYLHYMKAADQKYVDTLQKKIVSTQLRYNAIQLCIYRLTIEHSDEIVAELKKQWRIKESDFDINNPERHAKAIRSVQAQSKKLVAEIELKKYELEQIEARQKKGNDFKKKDFLKMLIQVQNHSGYQLSVHKTTVFEFVERWQNLRADVEASKSKK